MKPAQTNDPGQPVVMCHLPPSCTEAFPAAADSDGSLPHAGKAGCRRINTTVSVYSSECGTMSGKHAICSKKILRPTRCSCYTAGWYLSGLLRPGRAHRSWSVWHHHTSATRTSRHWCTGRRVWCTDQRSSGAPPSCKPVGGTEVRLSAAARIFYWELKAAVANVSPSPAGCSGCWWRWLLCVAWIYWPALQQKGPSLRWRGRRCRCRCHCSSVWKKREIPLHANWK